MSQSAYGRDVPVSQNHF